MARNSMVIRRWPVLMMATLAATSIMAASAVTSVSTAAAGSSWQTVVVSGAGDAAAAVRAAGGQVIAGLPLIGAVAAKLPAGSRLPLGFTVVPQRALHVAASSYNSDSHREARPQTEPGHALGNGVTVAVVDTGVYDSPDLAGRLSHVDVTGDGVGDGYGHGTFLAGLIAGNGASSNGAYVGVAPEARILDVRVAHPDGSTDLVTVLRGLQAVASHPEVRVVNLALASDSPLPYQVDPLDQALEALWRRGVTVVVPSGNDGPTPGSVTSPGDDPVLLTAGALDDAGTADRSDDTVASWSGRGPSWQGVAKPDLVAPGVHLVGLRAPGSVVDVQNPQARVGTSYFRGSGTSMSTAVLCGAVADLLSNRDSLRPDTVKQLLTSTAYQAAGLSDRSAAGAGGLDLVAALAADPSGGSGGPQRDDDAAEAVAADAAVWQALNAALATGNRRAAELAWSRLSPLSRSWAAAAWSTLDPASRSWASRSWSSRSWADGSAPDGVWLSRSWAAATWVEEAWASRSWASRSWASRSWADDSWASRSWASGDWSSRSWSSRSWSTAGWGGGS